MSTHTNQHPADAWIELLAACDPDDLDRIEETIERIPVALRHAVGDRGGSAVRERLYAPILAEAERDGLIEWSGERDARGQKIWRVR
jgi:hypothetical protein